MVSELTQDQARAATADLSRSGSALNPAGAVRHATVEALHIPRFTEAEAGMRIDGAMDEDVWSRVPAYDHMIVSSPDRDERPRYRTHTFMFYTERGLYVGAWNEQPTDTLLPRLTSRDSFRDSDSFQFSIDSSGNGLYGYWFSVKLGGSLSDGIIQPERSFRRNWDGPWRGNAVETEDGWTVEMFLPWSMMSMPEAPDGSRRMGFSVSRELGELHERWSWPALPFTQPKFLSALQPFELTEVAPRQDFSIYPYATASQDIHRDENDQNVGFDVFWRPSSSFLLSAAVNPDFGQVEADDVVVNLTAFETFFPEKRLFFLENQETFSTGGGGFGGGFGDFGGTTLLHTRRIGSSVGSRRGSPDLRDDLDFDGLDVGKPVDLIGAAKGAGQWRRSRWGVMTAIEDDADLRLDDGSGTVTAAGRDFGVLRWLYEDTTSGGRRAFGWLGTVAEHPLRRAVTQSLDGHYRTADSRWSWDTQLLASDISDDSLEDTTGIGGIVDVAYAPKRGHRHSLHVESFDDDIELNDLGFLNRNGFSSARYNFTARDSNVPNLRERRDSIGARAEYNTDGRFIGGFVTGSRRWSLENNMRFQVNLDYMPEQWDDRNSRGNGDFKLHDRYGTILRWNSDRAAPIGYEVRAEVLSESQDGYWRSLRGEISYRPIDQISMRLQMRYITRDSWLIWQDGVNFTTYSTEEWRPRFEIDTFFTARQQLRLELNWVGIKADEEQRYVVPGDGFLVPVARDPGVDASAFAISDIVVQLRYRWQIAPLSDLFIVYNRGGRLPDASVDDSFSGLFADTFSDPQNEALIMKLRYRLGT